MRVTAALLASLAGVGAATASLSGLVGAWGRDFAVTPFEPMPLMVAGVKDKKTGDTMFNLVKLPNETVMALVPLDQVREMPRVAPKDMVMTK